MMAMTAPGIWQLGFGFELVLGFGDQREFCLSSGLGVFIGLGFGIKVVGCLGSQG